MPLQHFSPRRRAFRALLALLALTLGGAGLVAWQPDPAMAQTPPLFVYGGGLQLDDAVAAQLGGVTCASTVVDNEGGWALSVEVGPPCNPEMGDTVRFTVNGKAAAQTIAWKVGGIPADSANGITLTLANTPPVTAMRLGRGVHLQVFAGGSFDSLRDWAPDASSFWVSRDGAFVGYIPGALAAANRDFEALHAGGELPAGTVLIVLVR